MCLFIDKPKIDRETGFPVPKIAKKNIEVYKVFSWMGSGELHSPYMYYPYEKGKLYESQGMMENDPEPESEWREYDGFMVEKTCDIFRVGCGIHSYTSLPLRFAEHTSFYDAKERRTFGYEPSYAEYIEGCHIIIKCTIPKGAKYFIGDSGDIVSNKIIVGWETIDPFENNESICV